LLKFHIKLQIEHSKITSQFS